MIRFRCKKTGRFYALLAHGLDMSRGRPRPFPVVVYSPEDDPHAIYVMARGEFYEAFEETGPEAA